MNRARVFLPLAGSIALLLTQSDAADFQKASNTDALNAATSWTVVNGADADGVPDSDDLLIWESVTAPNISALGADLSTLGIRIGAVGGTRNAAANYVGITGATNTLTIGSSGIDMTAALQPLRIESMVTLAAAQTWNIADASTGGAGFNKAEDLVFFGTTAGVALNLGGFTVTKTGSGTAAIGTGYTLSNGVINLDAGILQIQSGGSRTTTVESNLSINVSTGASLRVAAESGPGGTGGIAINSSGTFTLNAGSTFLNQLNQNNAMNLNGNIIAAGDITWQVQGGGFTTALATFGGNLTGSGNITYQNTATVANGLMRFTGDNSGYAGTFTINGASNNRILRLSGANSGSANATWSVVAGNILQIDGVAVQLGTLNGGGVVSASSGVGSITVGAGNFTGLLQDGDGVLGLTKIGNGTLTLTSANNYSGGTTVSAGTLTISSGQTGGGAVSVAGGATLALKVPGANATFPTSALTLGSASGSTLQVDLGPFGSPTVPVITANTLARNGITAVKILGGGFNGSTFRLVDYSSSSGSGTFTLSLPFRVTGSITDNIANTSLDLTLTAETPKWRGNVNGNWDIDPNNTGASGTANWRTSASDAVTRYVEGGAGVDSVIFDESATGTRNINVSTTVSPAGVLVNNTGQSYTFGGSGKISGSGSVTKSGTGTLVLANSTAYDYTGGTLIAAGTLQIGDGVTPGLGIAPSGTITNEATISLNRPDDYILAANISGNGSVVKNNVNVVTVASSTMFGNVTVSTGTLRYDNGGVINGILSGSGILSIAGGTLQLLGTSNNTFNGTTEVSAGILQLNKTGGVAIGGTINFTGTGGLTLSQADQIADTAIINYDKSANGGNIIFNDTVAAINMLNGADLGAQVQGNTGFNVTGLLTGNNSSVFSIASNHSGSVGGLNLSGSAIIRIAANSNPSILTVGTLGITASGGNIQVGQGTGAFDAVLNLGGNVTTTGNLNFSDGNFTGPQLRAINLTAATNTFNIGEFTTTMIAPDIGGTGALTKTGTGTLMLTPASTSTYTGLTTVNAGILQVNGSITGTTAVDLSTTGTLAGTGSVAPAAGGNVSLLAGGRISPGQDFAPGNLSIMLSGGGALRLASGVTVANAQALLFDLDLPTSSDKITLSGGALNIGTGVLEFDDFTFTPLGSFDKAASYTLVDGDTSIVGTLGAVRAGMISGQLFQLQLANGNTDLVLAPVPEPGSALLPVAVLGLAAQRRRRAPSA